MRLVIDCVLLCVLRRIFGLYKPLALLIVFLIVYFKLIASDIVSYSFSTLAANCSC